MIQWLLGIEVMKTLLLLLVMSLSFELFYDRIRESVELLKSTGSDEWNHLEGMFKPDKEPNESAQYEWETELEYYLRVKFNPDVMEETFFGEKYSRIQIEAL